VSVISKNESVSEEKKKEILILHRNLNWWREHGLGLLSHPQHASRMIWYISRRAMADCLYPFGHNNYPHRVFFIAGMAMSATTLMKNLMVRIPGVFTRPTPMPEELKENGDICDSAFKYVPKNGNTLFKTHLRPLSENIDCLFRNGVDKVVVTYRDLRDVAVARYHRLVEFPKSKRDPLYMDYRTMEKEKAMNHSIEVVKDHFIPWIYGWIKLAQQRPDNICLIRFEDLIKDTHGSFHKVLKFYDIPLTDEKINQIVNACKGRGNMRQNMRTAQFLPWGYSSNFRSGKIGNWKNEFSEDNLKRSKDLLGSALIELGYEKDLNWINEN